MKTSIDFLPEEKQEELSYLVECIRETVPEAQYIILYGSYARNDYVAYDQRVEYGVRTFFRSDYDIVVLTPKRKAGHSSVLRRLSNARVKFEGGRHFAVTVPVSFLPDTIEDFNVAITEGRYFVTDIVRQGIVLYNSGKYEIEEIRELNYKQILALSQEYYKAKYTTAEDFLEGAVFYYQKGKYARSSFMLHQATENYVLAIILTASLYASKEHNLTKILKNSERFTDKAVLAFPTDNEDDKRLFKLLENAYVQARYNKDFPVTKEDIDKLLLRIEQLRVNTQEVCLTYIEEHRKRAEEL